MSNIEGTVPCCDAKSSLPCGDAECCTGNGITGRTGKCGVHCYRMAVRVELDILFFHNFI